MNAINLSHTRWESLSNLPFIFVGFYWITHVDLVAGVSIVLMGAGSMYSHASRDYLPDWYAMYLCFAALIGFYLSQLVHTWHVGTLYALSLWIGAMACVFHEQLARCRWNFPLRAHYVTVAILYLIGAILSLWVWPVWIAVTSIVVFAIGYVVRQKVDHGLWHIIIAIALGILTQ